MSFKLLYLKLGGSLIQDSTTIMQLNQYEISLVTYVTQFFYSDIQLLLYSNTINKNNNTLEIVN